MAAGTFLPLFSYYKLRARGKTFAPILKKKGKLNMCNNCNGCFRGILNLFNNNCSCGCSGWNNGKNGGSNGCGCSSCGNGNNVGLLNLLFNGNNGNSGCGCGCSNRSVPNNNNCGCYDAYYAMQYGLTNNGCGCSNWYNLNVRSGCGCSSCNSGCSYSNRSSNYGFLWNWWGNGFWNN